jgi:hypothetical protein
MPWMTDPLRHESERLKPLTKAKKAKLLKLA